MDTFILLSILSWHLADFHSVTMPALLLPSSHQSAQDKIRNQNKAIFRSALKVLYKSLLHRSRQEGSVAEDVEDILGGWNEEGLALLDMNAIDMRFTPQANDHHKGICMEVNLRRHLHHYSINREIGAMDKFGVGFGRIVGRAVLRPYLIIDRLFGFGYMQFAWVAVRILASEVIDAVGDIRSLLDLYKKITRSDGVQSSGREEIEVSLVGLMRSDDILHR